MNSIVEFLRTKTTVILDGAMGTELQRRGYRTTLPLWTAKANTEAPELVKQIHVDYVNAGADIITTNTFRTIRYTYEKQGNREAAIEATLKAVALAKSAVADAGRKVYIAGSVSTLEDCYEPQLVPNRDVLLKEHVFQIKLLASLGVDLLLAETINSIAETAAIAQGAAEADIPFFLSFVTDGKGKLLSGEKLADAVKEALPSHPTAILLNCGSLEKLDGDLSILRNIFEGDIGAYANGLGMPDEKLGWRFEGNYNPVEKYLEYAEQWISNDTKIIGGCCGTSPEYIKGISELVEGIKNAKV